MSYELKSETYAWIDFDIVTWTKILDLAKFYGWEPAGTIDPAVYFAEDADDPEQVRKVEEDKKNWEGDYTTNSGQEVTAADALALAAALERSLDDIPDNRDMPPHKITVKAEDADNLPDGINFLIRELGGDGMIISNPNLHPYEYFGGDRKEMIFKFIDFCRAGAFRIW